MCTSPYTLKNNKNKNLNLYTLNHRYQNKFLYMQKYKYLYMLNYRYLYKLSYMCQYKSNRMCLYMYYNNHQNMKRNKTHNTHLSMYLHNCRYSEPHNLHIRKKLV